MIDWIDIRVKYPEMSGEMLLVTDGQNVAIHSISNFIFNPLKLIRGTTKFFMPKFWYNLNDIQLPEG